MEEWKEIAGYEGYYQISNTGKVKSLSRIAADGRNRVLKEKICSTKPNGNGYCHVELSKNNTKRTFKVHRLVADAFLPNPLNKRVVNHLDFNRSNNDVSNLQWATDQENVLHTVVSGRQKFSRPIGEKNGQSKIQSIDVLAIRSSNDSYSVIARNYNISISAVSSIKNKKRWAHV